jgi:hypothetical protein
LKKYLLAILLVTLGHIVPATAQQGVFIPDGASVWLSGNSGVF